MRRPGFGPALAVLALLLCAGYTALSLKVQTGFAPFAGSAGNTTVDPIVRALADAGPARSMWLRIAAADPETTRRAARRLADRLRAHPEVETADVGPPAGIQEALLQGVLPRRLLFLSDRPARELPARLSDAGLREAAGRLRAALAGPEGPLAARFAAEDPLLSVMSALRRAEGLRAGGLHVDEGVYTSDDGRFALISVRTRHSPFDVARQAPLLDDLARAGVLLERELDAPLVLEQASLHRFAVASERVARRDVTRLSSASAGAVATLFLLIFGSLRLLLLAFVPLLSGVIAASAATLAASGQIHLLTLAFGSTLIGVCIDYPIHLGSHHVLMERGEPGASLRRVGPAIAMGAVTTLAAFGAFGLSPLPGLRELGLFSVVGVVAAALATRWLVAPLLPSRTRSGPLRAPLAHLLGKLVDGFACRRGIAAALCLGCCGLALAGLPNVAWQDDVSSWNVALDPEQLAEDQRVRTTFGRDEPGRLVIATGIDEQEALRRNDAAAVALATAQSQDELGGFRSLHALLWSADLQRRNAAAIRSAPGLEPRLSAAFAAEGFRPEAFAPFFEHLAGPPPDPLRPDDLREAGLGRIVDAFRIEHPGGVAFLSFLQGVESAAALEARLDEIQGVHFVDHRRLLEDTYRGYRERTLPAVGLGVAGISLLALARYRRVSLALAAVLPAGLGAGAALGGVALASGSLSLLHLLGGLLVLGFGVDYSIFLLESRGDREELVASAIGILIASGSTVLSFGMLAFSHFPALRALGSSTSLGVLLSLALAPTALALAGRQRRSRW